MAYIDRDLLLKDIEESVVFTVRGQNSLEIKGANKITDRIKQMPTADVVEVVRCEKCKYGDMDETTGFVCCTNPNTPFHRYKEEFCMYKNNFCSFGKRKEGD